MSVPDLVQGGVLVALGVVVYIASAQLAGGSPSDPLGPRGFPTLIALGVTAAGAALAVRALLGARRPSLLDDDDEDDDEPLAVSRLALAALAVVLYVFVALPFLGFLLSTVVFVAALITAQGGVGRRPFIAMSLGFPVAVYLLFSVVLDVSLPIGIFFVDPIDLLGAA